MQFSKQFTNLAHAHVFKMILHNSDHVDYNAASS